MSGTKKEKMQSEKSADNGTEEQPSTTSVDETIRERAYIKWEAAGCPCCDGAEFWLEAEAEVNSQSHPGEERTVSESKDASSSECCH